MFLLSNICDCIPNLFVTRRISCSSARHNNHYVTLGLTPSASQGEIKKAYFELCKKYHPDKNDGSAASTKMFRKITEAYEILGNEKARRLYDQRMFYAGPRVKQTVHRPEDYNYEAERYFYERTRFRRKFTGKTAYYDFDAWVNAHYPKAGPYHYKVGRDYSRTWRSFSQKKKTDFGRVQLPFLAIKFIGLFLMGIIIVSLPSTSMDSNYGINNNMSNSINHSQSPTKMNKSDGENPFVSES